MKKYYRISDLINDYMKLKKENERLKKQNLKDILSFWEMVSGNVANPEEFKGLNVNKIIAGFKSELKNGDFS